MNKQEIFDKVLSHMRTQKVRSGVDGACVYYNPDTGNKCAIGALIPTELYDPIFDDLDANFFTGVHKNEHVQEALLKVGIELNHDMIKFLCSLQIVHDSMKDTWGDTEEEEMRYIASKNTLVYLAP